MVWSVSKYHSYPQICTSLKKKPTTYKVVSSHKSTPKKHIKTEHYHINVHSKYIHLGVQMINMPDFPANSQCFCTEAHQHLLPQDKQKKGRLVRFVKQELQQIAINACISRTKLVFFFFHFWDTAVKFFLFFRQAPLYTDHKTLSLSRYWPSCDRTF